MRVLSERGTGTERLFWVVAGVMIAAAAVATLLTILEASPSGSTCPSAETARICLGPYLDGQMYAVTFNQEPLEGADTSALMVGILSASAAILAISFTLNQVILSNVSQRYSSRIVELHAKAPTKAFGAFVLMVSGSATLLLVHDSLPALFAVYTVMFITFCLFVALCIFTRGFIHMKQVMSPHSFIKGAQLEILANMTGSQGESVRVQSLREKQSLGTIQSLGDTAIKSLNTSDTDICIACVDALYDVGEAFLTKRRSNPDDYVSVDEPRLDLLCNMHANYVIDEFLRILKSASSENASVTHNLLRKSHLMAALAMQDKNNESLIKILYDTCDLKGSFYLQLVDRISSVGSDPEKNRMMRHLADLAATKDLHMPFVEQFLTHHVFRSIKLIVDRDNFDLFKEVIRLFSRHYFFTGMKNTQDLIKYGILQYSGLQDSNTPDPDRIAFEMGHHTKKDFRKILELKDEVERMISQISRSPNTDTTRDSGTELSPLIDQLYIYSLLWGTFFRIACYVVGKGDKYAKYLRELWYHARPRGQSYHTLNMPPCSKDVDWNSMYAVQQGHSRTHIIVVDDAESYEPYLHEYAALHMLREDKIWHVPTDTEIDEWGRSGREYALEYHYEVMYEMDAGPFLKALDFLGGSNLPSEMLPDIDVRARIASVRKKLEVFGDGREHILKKLVARMSVDPEKIKEWQRNVHVAYSESTKADTVARIKYDAQLIGSATFLNTDYMPHSGLVRKGYLLLDGRLGERSASAELGKILKVVGNSTESIQTDSLDLLDSIKLCIKKISDGGRAPRVVSISTDGIKRILETRPGVMLGDAMDVDGTRLQIADPRLGGQDVLVFDPDCVEVTYQTEDKAGRLQLDAKEVEQEPDVTVMTSSIFMSVKILDRAGLAKINSSASPSNA